MTHKKARGKLSLYKLAKMFLFSPNGHVSEEVVRFDPWSCHEAVIGEGWVPGGLNYFIYPRVFVFVIMYSFVF